MSQGTIEGSINLGAGADQFLGRTGTLHFHVGRVGMDLTARNGDTVDFVGLTLALLTAGEFLL